MLNMLQENVKKLFDESDMLKYYFHTERVYGYVKELLAKQKRNNDLLLAAALVHDIGRVANNGFVEHITMLNSVAQPVLFNVGYSKEDIDEILRIANSHHPRADEKLHNVDEMLLYDADNLDLVGVLGFMRWFGSVPNEILNMVDSAKMYLTIYDTEISKKGSLFYTSEAKILGESSAIENTLLCKALIQSIENMHIVKAFDNRYCSFSSALFGKYPQSNQLCQKTLVLLSGYRCSGKSHIRSILHNYFDVDVFDTNSKKTQDLDANLISPKEVIERYGEGKTYLLFLANEIREFINQSSKNLIVIDSIKTLNDIDFFIKNYPEHQIITLWLHCPADIREQRYISRDVKNNIRSEDISAHDSCLEELGIMEVAKNADIVLNTNRVKENLILQLATILNSL